MTKKKNPKVFTRKSFCPCKILIVHVHWFSFFLDINTIRKEQPYHQTKTVTTT